MRPRDGKQGVSPAVGGDGIDVLPNKVPRHNHYRKRGLAVRSNLCRASFIERTTKKLSAVRRTKRTAKNLCRASYFLTHDKDSLPCVLILGAGQRFFSFSTFAINGR
jgi:hypothetical protein